MFEFYFKYTLLNILLKSNFKNFLFCSVFSLTVYTMRDLKLEYSDITFIMHIGFYYVYWHLINVVFVNARHFSATKMIAFLRLISKFSFNINTINILMNKKSFKFTLKPK